MRLRSTVSELDARPDTVCLDPGTPGFGSHLPFYSVLERVAIAWTKFLDGLEHLEPSVILPHVSADFSAEVRPGEMETEILVHRVGTSSFTLRCRITQNDAVAAVVDVVLVAYDYTAGCPAILNDDQRRELLALSDGQGGTDSRS